MIGDFIVATSALAHVLQDTSPIILNQSFSMHSITFSWPLWADVLIFAIATVAIAVAGTRLAGYADRLADRSGLGEAVTGALFLGLATALPGLTASIVAAVQGHAVLAISNAIGGIAFQTTILAVADMTYRRANLEHAAASLQNMMQTIMLVLLLSLVLTGFAAPEITIVHVHPMTFVLLFAAVLAFWLVYRVRETPMWRPRETTETVEDTPAPGSERESLAMLGVGLALTGLVTLLGGAAVALTAGDIVRQTAIPEAVVGALFMAVATSLPELVTCVASVRRGALTLAVGDIVGGNFFDVLFVAAADVVYLKGSIYHAQGIGKREIFLTALTILLNVILLAGLINRQKYGPANIGFESILMLAFYLAGFATLALAM